MNRIAKFASAIGLLFSGCSKQDTPEQFTKSFAAALKAADPAITFQVVRPLELKLKQKNGRDATCFLYNAYDLYKQDPLQKSNVIKKYVASGLETVGPVMDRTSVDVTRIVPVIKDRPWMDETRKAMLDRGAKETLENVFEEFAPGLVILYAEDSPKSIRYLTPEDLTKAKLEKSALKKLAAENLRRVVPKFEIKGGNGIYMVVAGGDYEASFLAYDPMWEKKEFTVDGDPVVAIPARDLLMVTGSNDKAGIQKLKDLIQKVFANASYKLTKDLYVYRDGKFQKFSE